MTKRETIKAIKNTPHGHVYYKNKTYTLTQDAYAADPRNGVGVYQAHAVDADDNVFRVTWEITNTTTENADETCDWDDPIAVEAR